METSPKVRAWDIVRRVKWWVVVLVPLAAVVWLEIFLRYQVEAVILLVAIGGWWDYMRRRQKLKPPED
jgi:hypothetical protein